LACAKTAPTACDLDAKTPRCHPSQSRAEYPAGSFETVDFAQQRSAVVNLLRGARTLISREAAEQWRRERESGAKVIAESAVA
jgi:hypothetical protein